MRNRLVNDKPLYDVLLYCANWPEVRSAVWKKLLPARSIENQSFVIGSNCVGTDGNNNVYNGESAFINPRGEYLHEMAAGSEEVSTQVFFMNELSEFREKFPVLNDADDFSISQ
jgi:predicted amidohydrolase